MNQQNGIKIKQFILFALLLFAFDVGHAQTNMATVSGKVIDENNFPIEYAS